ncbi:MAG: thiamine ABC transporter substrate-binding protein [Acidimicrobiia bacterium]|nr:thiamine ABC transporter substrate-binding protein [Acidimicrobiia bacterium]
MRSKTLALLLGVGLALTACTTEEQQTDTITLLTHDSFWGGVTDETFATFTTETGISVEVLPAGDAGSMVNQAILTKDRPVADVLFGVDDTFLSRAVEAGIFLIYRSPLLSQVPDGIAAIDEHVTPIDFGDVCLNYDRAVISDAAAPMTLDDLTGARFSGQLVVENPATSSPGLAFLLATIARYGEDGWQDYWRSLVANGVKVAPDWDTAYYADFTRWGGDRPLVVSYASSPPAEVVFSETPIDIAPTGVVTDGCYRQVEFAGILAGTPKEDAARQLIDFMLSVEFQEQIPLTWFVFPANELAALPAEFVAHTVIPSAPLRLPPTNVERNRERWIAEWTEIVLP